MVKLLLFTCDALRDFYHFYNLKNVKTTMEQFYMQASGAIGVFLVPLFVNFEHISHLILMFLLLSLSR